MITKYGSVEIDGVLEVRSMPGRVRSASLDNFSSYNNYRTDDGYIYTRVRAISSRVNKNFDGWPSDELARAFRTFVGKPIFIDHNNSDPHRSRGVVVDAILHVDEGKLSSDSYYATAANNHKPPTWIELLLETDASRFPKLASDLINGDIDSVSMGANVEKTSCSICNNVAHSADDFCDHVKLKGAHFDHWDDKGKRTSKLAYEDCHDISFFEISYVFDPADTTALVHEVKTTKTAGGSDDYQIRHDDIPDPRFDRYLGLTLRQLRDVAMELDDPNAAEFYQHLTEPPSAERSYGNPPAAHDEDPSFEDEFLKPLEGDVAEQTDKHWNNGDMNVPHEQSADERGFDGPAFKKQYQNDRFKDYLMQNQYAPTEFEGVEPNEWDPDKNPDPRDPRRMSKIDRMIHEIFKEAAGEEPQSMSLVAPDPINTLRVEKACPVCGSEMEDGNCSVCGFEEPPASFDNPDLDLAQQVRDLIENSQENLADGGQPEQPPMPPGMDGGQGGPPAPGAGAPMPPQSAAGIPMPTSATKYTGSSNVTSEWDISIRSKVASKINKNEVPILPTTRSTSDLAKTPKIVKDSLKPVESKAKENTSMNWETTVQEMKSRGIDPFKISALVQTGVIEKLIDRISADAVADPAEFPNQAVDAVGQEYGNPEADTDHSSVEALGPEQTGPNTMTFGDNGTDAVTSEIGSAGVGPIGSPVASVKQTGGFPDTQPTKVNLEAPLKEEVGPNTMTFKSDGFHVGDPVTNVDGSGELLGGPIGGVVSAADIKRHVFASIRLAELEVGLGMIAPEEKFDRAAILEQQSPEQLVQHEQTLGMVRKAAVTRRQPVQKLPAGISKAGHVVESSSSSNDDDSALFM